MSFCTIYTAPFTPFLSAAQSLTTLILWGIELSHGNLNPISGNWEDLEGYIKSPNAGKWPRTFKSCRKLVLLSIF